ncbi:MAG: hypothetical protein HY456_02795 [Parcubacteria group bacterium]|nr:hypothetical protein [Parcubacteria group bacterium]
MMDTPLQKALIWAKERLKENPSASKLKLADQASLKFNLSPRDGESLIRQFVRGQDSREGQ